MSQEFVTGRVRLKLYKGSAVLVGRESPYSLYDQELVTFEEGAVAYDHRDAEGLHQTQRVAAANAGEAQTSGLSDRSIAPRWTRFASRRPPAGLPRIWRGRARDRALRIGWRGGVFRRFRRDRLDLQIREPQASRHHPFGCRSSGEIEHHILDAAVFFGRDE